MITISSRLLRQLRPVLRRALCPSPRRPAPPVTLRAGPDGLRIRAISGTAAAEYHLRGRFPVGQVVVPFEWLGDCEGGRDEPVTLEPGPDGSVLALWTDRGTLRERRYPRQEVPEKPFPEPPPRLARNSPGLLNALADAWACADRQRSRYALCCLQLRGRKGVISATDSRHLLVQSGFRFPWDGGLLVPASPVFGGGGLPTDQPVHVGRTEDALVLRVGPWTLHLFVDREGRYPRVDEIVRPARSARASLTLAEADAAALERVLRVLPGGEEDNRPVTLDLGGTPAVRGRSEREGRPHEFPLEGSKASGRPLRVDMNREFLARAARLGFRTLHALGPGDPLQARDERRVYVWMPLSGDGAIPPDPRTVRVKPPPAEAPAHRRGPTPAGHIADDSRTSPGRPRDRRVAGVPRPTSPAGSDAGSSLRRRPLRSTNGPPASPGDRQIGSEVQPPELEDIAAQAVSVRDALRASLAGVTALLSRLRSRRPRSASTPTSTPDKETQTTPA